MNKLWLWAVTLTMAFGQTAENGWSQTVVRQHAGADTLLIPSKDWPCGKPAGIPVPKLGVPVFSATMKLEFYDVGLTPYGHRQVCVLQSGTVTGEKINGEVLPGGLDFELVFTNGTREVEQVLVLKTSTGKYIYMRSAGTAAEPGDVRMVPEFEAPFGSEFDWLNSGKYAGQQMVDLAAKTLTLSVFDISRITVLAGESNSVQVIKPAGFRPQSWDYRRAAAGEHLGAQIITENVTLGRSVLVGATKNGGRNIIPITGGTLTGKITGKVLFGGADYQKLGNPVTLEARYLWQTEEGDVIIVRNAGPINSLVPTFEVRSDSKYAFLNGGTYLSSSPSMGAGGLKLNFNESSQ